MNLLAPPRRITRPDGAILGFAPELDPTLQPGRQQLADMVLDVVKAA
jgi:pyruvate dehydrogenase E1 component beta subunit